MRSERDQDRERLEQDIGSETYASLLRRLQQPESFLCRFRAWSDVIAFMRRGRSDDPRKDEVLRPILEAHAADMDPRWRAILLVVFWPGFDSICNRKQGWDTDEDERWQNVMWAFLQAVCKLDVSARSDRLVQRIINNTIHRLHDEYRRIWKRADRETAVDPELLEDMTTRGTGVDFDEIDRRLRQQAEIKRLRDHMEAGRITEADFLLLVGTRVYGKSAAQYARETGISCDLARKRRLRAEAAIRRAEEEK